MNNAIVISQNTAFFATDFFHPGMKASILGINKREVKTSPSKLKFNTSYIKKKKKKKKKEFE